MRLSIKNWPASIIPAGPIFTTADVATSAVFFCKSQGTTSPQSPVLVFSSTFYPIQAATCHGLCFPFCVVPYKAADGLSKAILGLTLAPFLRFAQLSAFSTEAPSSLPAPRSDFKRAHSFQPCLQHAEHAS